MEGKETEEGKRKRERMKGRGKMERYVQGEGRVRREAEGKGRERKKKKIEGKECRRVVGREAGGGAEV